jgi:hypothetical protein
LKLPDRPEGGVGMNEDLVLFIVAREREELIEELLILKQPISG